MKKIQNLKEIIKKSMAWLLILMAGIKISVVAAYATAGTADISKVTAPINNLVMLLEAIAAAIGVLIVIWNVIKLGQALPAHDNAAINMAILGITGGAIMTVTGSVLAIMGVA